MSSYIKRQIDGVEDNIYFLERERDELHYEVYVCHRERWLHQYKLTLKELENQYDELRSLQKRYKIELSKERAARASEELKSATGEVKRVLATLTSQVQCLVGLENAKNAIEHETNMEIQCGKDTNPEDPFEEVKQVEDTKISIEEQVEEILPQPDYFKIVDDYKVVDIIEVEHIDFIIPEYSFEPPFCDSPFLEFFAPQPFLKKSTKFILVPSHPCVILDFYKTRGRVFSNKGSFLSCIFFLSSPFISFGLTLPARTQPRTRCTHIPLGHLHTLPLLFFLLGTHIP